jgi:hypothetical protein
MIDIEVSADQIIESHFVGQTFLSVELKLDRQECLSHDDAFPAPRDLAFVTPLTHRQIRPDAVFVTPRSSRLPGPRRVDAASAGA